MKNIFIVTILLLVISFAGFALFNNRSQTKDIPLENLTPSPTPTDERVDIRASFTIITGNITRSFKAEKYHNQSPDVYIEASDPTIVHVKKAGITWNDFFKTLPMKLTKMCLTTGDGETFCDGKEGVLKFNLNNIEDKDALDKEINTDDNLLVTFGN